MKKKSITYFKPFLFLSLAIPTFFAAWISWGILLSSNVQFANPTYESVELFFVLFSKPLLILSSALPFCAFVISYYRYEQTQEILHFNRYIEHMKLFKERISERKDLLNRIEPTRMYDVMYPKAKNGDFDLSKFQKELYESIRPIIEYLGKYPDRKGSLLDSLFQFNDLHKLTREHLGRFGIRLGRCSGINGFLAELNLALSDIEYLISSDYFSKAEMSNEILGAITLLESTNPGDLKFHIKGFLKHDFSTPYKKMVTNLT